MSTVSTYNILSFCINFQFCFLIFFILFSMSSFKSRIRRKSRAFPSHWKRTSRQNLESKYQPLCHVKGAGRGTVWHIARWKTLVVVSYDILPCEIHWLCYRMAHCHIALVVVPYGAFSYWTGCITVWHIARWKALVVLLYDTLPGERHWSWYCMTHCHVKGTSHGTVWHIARWEALTWYCKTHYQVKYIGSGTA